MAQMRWPVLVLGLLWLWGCGGARDPVVEMQRTLASAPDYMIVLDDMREEGTFFPQYYHRYLVTQGERKVQTDWIEVPEDIFQKYESFLGMALASKTSDGVNDTPHPAGYDRVGDPKYGQWVERNGTSFWQFYGQYALMRDLIGLGGGMISRGDYDDYRTSRRSNQPYYGRNNEWGTKGTVTQQQRPSTFERRKQAINQKQQSFSQKIQSRAKQGTGFGGFGSTGRSRTGFGSRSFGGFGK